MHCLRTVPGFNVNGNSTEIPPLIPLEEPSHCALVQLAFELYDGRTVYDFTFPVALDNLTNTDRRTFIEAIAIRHDEWASVGPLSSASPDLPYRGEDRTWKADRNDEWSEHPISTRAERLRGQ